MNILTGWFLGLLSGIGMMGMFVNFPLWSDNDVALWLSIAMVLMSCLLAIYFTDKEEKTNLEKKHKNI